MDIGELVYKQSKLVSRLIMCIYILGQVRKPSSWSPEMGF